MADGDVPTTDTPDGSYYDVLGRAITQANTDDSPEMNELVRQYVGHYLADVVKLDPSDPNPDADGLADTLKKLLGGDDTRTAVIYGAIYSYVASSRQFSPPTPATPPAAGDPVNLATGQFDYNVVDFTVAGAGIDLVFSRTYKSGSFYNGPFGPCWDHSANLWLLDNGDGSVTVTTGGLRPVCYILNELVDAPYYVALGDDDIVVRTADDTFEKRAPNGYVMRFVNLTGDGQLYQVVQATDRIGNYLRFFYDDQFRLSTLRVNNISRVVTFLYDDQHRIIQVSLFPTTYSTDAGSQITIRSWSYAYDDFGDLVSVTPPATDEFPQGRVTQYGYSSSSSFAARQHDLLTITDPEGNTFLENEYGQDEGAASLGKVVSQRVGAGIYFFDYRNVLDDPSWTYSDAEQPATCVTVTQRNGHSIYYVLNALGNILLSKENVLNAGSEQQVTWRYAYDADGRRIAQLSPEGRVVQTYYGRQYFYERPENPGDETLPPWLDPNLSIQEHAGFANRLATIQRSALFDFSTLSSDLDIYGDVFPAALAPDIDGNDIIVKFTYEPAFQQLASISDPRYTTSADPNSPESLDPTSAYSTHLTTVTFDASPAANRKSVTFPNVTFPQALPNGETGIAGAKLTFDAYDADGRLLQMTMPEGNVLAFAYFAGSAAQPTTAGFLFSRTVGLGTLNLTTSFAINEAGEITAITDPRGYTTQHEIDANSLLRAVTFPLADYRIAFAYDGNRQVISRQATIVAPDGSVSPGSPEIISFAYNCEGSLIRMSLGDSSGAQPRTTRRVYDPSNCLTHLVLPRGNTTCYEYDERLLPTRVTRACCTQESASTTYGYGLDGMPAFCVGPMGETTTLRLDAFGRCVGIVDPVGTVQRIDYDKLNNAVVRRWFELTPSGSYALLRRTECQFDERNRLNRNRTACFDVPIATADPWGAPDAEFNVAIAAGQVRFYDSLIYYDRNLRLTRVVDANGNATVYECDEADRRTKTTDAAGNYYVTSYDPASNVLRSDQYLVDTGGATRAVLSILYEYDPLNRLIGTTDGAGNVTTLGLDSRNLVCSRTDPLGRVVDWDFDGYRDRISETRALTQPGGLPDSLLTTLFSYDSNGNMLSVTDPVGRTTTFAYDQLDRRTTTVNSDGTERRTYHDRSSNCIKDIDEDGLVVNRVFDPCSRLKTIAVQSVVPMPFSAELLSSFQYDGLGVLKSHQNAFCETTRTSDSLGRCYRESVSVGPPLCPLPMQFTLQRQFDGNSNQIRLDYPSGQVFEQTFDGINRLTQVRSTSNAPNYPGDPGSAANRSLILKTWLGNLPISVELGNGAAVAYAYDSAGRYISTNCSTPTGEAFWLQQLWDGAGNRRISIEQSGGKVFGYAHGYDSINRLVGSVAVANPTLFSAGALAPPTSPLAESALAGQTAIDKVTEGYLPAAAAPSEFEYDLASNRTSASGVPYSTNSRNEYVSVGGAVLAYSASGRLTSDTAFDYAYNFRGQLIEAQSKPAGSVELQVFHDALGRVIGVVEGGVARLFISNGRSVIELYDKGKLSALSAYEGLDQLSFFAGANNDQYVVRDVIESTRVTLDAKAGNTGVFRYDPFGQLLAGIPTTPFLHGGKYLYASVGWYEYWRRQYIPRLGRFAQPDPAGFVDGLNLYAFLTNNPLSARDPGGTESVNATKPRKMDPFDYTKGPAVDLPNQASEHSNDLKRLVTLDLPPEKLLEAIHIDPVLPVPVTPTVVIPLSAMYGGLYSVKQEIYKPIKSLVLREHVETVDRNGHVVMTSIEKNHDDAIIAIGTIVQMALGALEPEEVPTLAPETQRAYQVLMSMELKQAATDLEELGYTTDEIRRWHFKEASDELNPKSISAQLDALRASEPQAAQMIVDAIHNNRVALHHGMEKGVMELVYEIEHTSPLFRDLFHPGGRGGMSRWGRSFGGP